MKAHLSRITRPLMVLLVVAACSAGAIQPAPADPGHTSHSVVQAYENLTKEQARHRADHSDRLRGSRSSAGERSTLPGYLRSYLQLFR